MKFVAVTACPTGIAHSQMGAENLETRATERGHDIQVEVQGAMGTENELTAENIEAADAVIIAADTSVSRDRFEGMPLVKGTIKDAVNDADALIDEAIEKAGGDVDEADADATAEEEDEDAAEADFAEPDAATESAGDDTETQTGTAEESGKSGGLIGRLKNIFS